MKFGASLLLVLVWCLQLTAKPPNDTWRLRVGEIAAMSVQAGDSVLVKIPITVASGFHVNANPAASDDYIPMEVRFDSTSGIRAGAMIYPKGKTWRLQGTTENLLVYGGDFEVKVPLMIDRDAASGKRVIKGSVDFQACDNHVCFLPESQPIAVTLNIVSKK
jgi:DsbC/DsbD-like thiol-disulfide interchange protein